MPKNRTLLASLIKQYGRKRGERIYYAMESEGKPAFRKGLATARHEGHITDGGARGKRTRLTALVHARKKQR